MKGCSIRRGVLAVCLFSAFLCGCYKVQKQKETDILASWLAQADLEAEETKEMLYERALGEDTLVIYSTTTRIYKVKDSFEAEYPGLTVEIYDMRATDMMEALQKAYDQQRFDCDIVISSIGSGELDGVLLEKHIVNAYIPKDIGAHLRPEAKGQLLNFTGECEQLFYNSQFQETCPISNWWELTEPEWYGRIYMNSPLRSHPAYSLLHGVISNHESMEQAYLDRYKEPLINPEGGNAGMEFWKRLVNNGIRFTTSSNDVVEIVGMPGQENPPMAFMISSKIRQNAMGLYAEPAYGVTPCDGVYSPNSVSIAGGARNINSAKLFIRWLMGETDGQGEGMKPYLLEGTWSVRDDVDSDSKISLEEGNFWYNDSQEVRDKSEEILKFWIELQEEAEKKE